ncbi:unnamed protein product [Brassica oleracea]
MWHRRTQQEHMQDCYMMKFVCLCICDRKKNREFYSIIQFSYEYFSKMSFKFYKHVLLFFISMVY